MTIKDLITTRYGTRFHAATKLFKRLSLQIASSKNRILFLERCLFQGITPKFLRQKCPIKSHRAQKLMKKHQKDLLHELL
jgi:hypothetical protein